MERSATLSRKNALLIALSCGFLMVAWLLTHSLPDWFGYSLIDILLAGSITFFILVGTSHLKMTRTMKMLVVTSYFVRLFLALIAVYGSGSFAHFLYDVDDIYSVALRFFTGDFSFKLTNYTTVLYRLFQITGTDKIVPAIINILLWHLGYFVIQNVSDDFYGREKVYFVLFYTFLPIELFYSIKIARESVIWLSLMLSFCCVLKWMQAGKNLHIWGAVLLALPAISMHIGAVAMWLSIVLIFACWSPKKQKWRFCSFRAVAVLTVVALIGIGVSVPFYNRFLAGYYPIDTVSDIPRKIAYRMSVAQSVAPGRSDYLTFDSSYRNPAQFLGSTLYLIIFYWISPTPRFWQSVIDAVGFFVDTVPWLLFFGLYFRNMRRKGANRIALAGVIVALVFTLVYAWGTKNAGTAMRHRGKLYGVMVMAAMVAAKRPLSSVEQIGATKMSQEFYRAPCAEE